MLSTEEVEHIASLARIGLSDGEKESYRKDLSGVLDFFRELEGLAVADDIAAGDAIPVKENDTRTDRVEECDEVVRDRILDGVPIRKDGFVKVRSVF